MSQPNANTTDHQDEPQRAILLIPDVTPPGLTTYDAKDPDAEYPPIRELRPPEGAPNVLVILLDDVGFGASSAFGGPCETGRSLPGRIGGEVIGEIASSQTRRKQGDRGVRTSNRKGQRHGHGNPTVRAGKPAEPPDMERLMAIAASYEIDILGPLPGR